MRLTGKTLAWLCLLFAASSTAWSADGRVLSFAGDVRVNGEPITTGSLLSVQDTIVTAIGASVTIVLSDNSVLDLDSDSRIQLSDYVYNAADPQDNRSEINIVEGTLRYVSGLMAKEDPDDIGFTAGNSTIGVRGSFTEIKVDGVVVNVESMIGEATLTEEEGGRQDTIVIPTGQATQKDPTTGQVLLAPATSTNKVNEVVHAITAISPDASTRKTTDEGCSQSARPLRASAEPRLDENTTASIETQLTVLPKGELMMVMAVLINNAGHLCIDTKAIKEAVRLITKVRPDAAADVVFTASLLDPGHADEYTDQAVNAAPDQADSIRQAKDSATDITREVNPAAPQPTPGPPVNTEDPEVDPPPGGEPPPPPSPE